MFLRLVVLATLVAFPVLAGPDDDFIEIYRLIQQTDAERESGEMARAREGYQQAQELLRTLKKGYPQWNERVVAYRLRYVAEKLEALPAVTNLPPAVVVAEPMPKPAEPDNEVVNQFNTLNREINALRGEKQRLEAKLREALSAQPAPVDPKQLQAAADRITQLQATNKLLLTQIELQQAERSSLVEKVLFDEAQQALTAANQQVSAQREKTVELERLRNLAEGELKRLREGEFRELKAENSTLRSQVDNLQSETERGQQIANLTERLATLQTKFGEAQRENEALATDRDKLERQLQALRARQSEEGIVRIKQLETDLALARAEADRHATAANQLEARLAVETGSRTRLEGENKELNARVEALGEQAAGLKILQTQLAAEQEERSELEAQLQVAEARLAATLSASLTNSLAVPGNAKAGTILPDPAMIAQIQMLSAETVRLREALRDGRARQSELTSLLAEAQKTTTRLEAEKRGLMKRLADLQATPSQRQLVKADRTIKSLEERVRELERERDKLAQKLALATDKSKSGIQFARRVRLGNPREDVQRFRAERN